MSADLQSGFSSSVATAATSVGGIGSAQASAQAFTSQPQPATVAGSLTTAALTTVAVSATDLGSTGSAAAAAAGAWDTLTFTGATAGQTATLTIDLTLATPTTGFTDVGFGGGCLSSLTRQMASVPGSLCDPFANKITGQGAHETLTTTFRLDQGPVLIWDALNAVADNDFNIATSTIDPSLLITLPSDVSFTASSGDNVKGSGSSGGGLAGVPEPATVALLGAGLAAVAQRRRRADRTGR